MKKYVSDEFLIKIWWNFVRLGWKKYQNLGLGVIYRTVPSESHDFKRIMLKIIKMEVGMNGGGWYNGSWYNGAKLSWYNVGRLV